MRRQLLADCVRERRFIVCKARESSPQGTFACGLQFVTDGIVVVQIQRAQERLERQALNHQRAQNDGECGQHNQVAIRKADRERQRRSEGNDAAHA